ncbi:MAG: 2-polyprenyl-3-methyl-5-hydroxy-6-metoxy-1,4-benzoquinol methylase [Planctomycetota bacterium]|jgi:2-polyprenyl-3-methyl-5-hydroxy-6-metoxy-1,4-benzoquinol methylase
MSANDAAVTPTQISHAARRLYAHTSVVQRGMMTLRPYLAPFDLLLTVVPPGSRVLDVGCGSGLFLAVLAWQERIGHSVGFDASGKAIAAAREMCTRLPANHKLEFQVRDAGEAWPAGDFDVISLIDLIHHLPYELHLPVIRQAARRVPPGGMLLYKDIGARPRWKAFANRMQDLIVAQEWSRYANLDEVTACAREEGLEPFDCRPVHRICFPHELGAFIRPQGPTK